MNTAKQAPKELLQVLPRVHSEVLNFPVSGCVIRSLINDLEVWRKNYEPYIAISE